MSTDKSPADKPRILTTKWVSDAWEKIKKKSGMKKYSFLKFDLSNNLDGTEDDQIKKGE